jgi:hypothetical protein
VEALLPQNWKTLTEAQWEAWNSNQSQDGGLTQEEFVSLVEYFDKAENFNKLTAGGKIFWTYMIGITLGTTKRLTVDTAQSKIGEFTYISRTANDEGGYTYLLAQVLYANLNSTYDGIYESLCSFFGYRAGYGYGPGGPGPAPVNGLVKLQDNPDEYVLYKNSSDEAISGDDYKVWTKRQ